MKQFLNASEVARNLEVDPATVTRWIKGGLFGSIPRAGERGRYRIPLDNYQNFIQKYKTK